MNEQRDPFESRGDRKGCHFGVGAKGGHCKQDSFICLLQEGMKYPVRVVLETLITFSTADQWTNFYESRPYPLVLDPLDILEVVCHLPLQKAQL
jgi:hypothetical protein